MNALRKFIPLILLIILEACLFATNFQAGTYLIGWDNVLPEFNFALNFKRSLFSLWQEYRGLGLLDGMAHGANLIHTTYLYLLSLVFPQEALRYIYIHLTHLAGGIGFFYLTRYLTKNTVASFLGALFYMLNIGIIQMYFAPLEVFATHFAALPWLALYISKTLKDPNSKNLLILFLIGVLTSPQGFVPTVFIAFSILVFFLFLFYFLKNRNLKPLLLAGLMLFLSQAFWMLPYAVSVLKTPQIIQSTRINQYASEEIYYRNHAHGDLLSVLGLNGFMISTVEYDHSSESDVYFMDAWRKHLSFPAYPIIYTVFFLIALTGIIVSLKKKNAQFYPFLATLGIAFVFLANNTPVLEQLNNLIRFVLPIIGEAFRFPFTKFITIFAFSLALFFALGLSFLLPRVQKFQNIFIALLVAGLIYLSLPAFQGNFTSPLLRLKVPTEYFTLMNYFENIDKNRRVAILPAHTFWNWHYRTWGHRGSGFLWYGIEQPTLERAFDPWSLTNEQYYNELSAALNAQDEEMLKNVVAKYNISYLLVDQYIINTLSTQPVNYASLSRFLDQSEFLEREKVFGRLLLYKVKAPESFVFAIPQNNTPNIKSNDLTRIDNAFATHGNYISTSQNTFNTFYPYSSLFTEKTQSDLTFTVEENDKTITISPTLDQPLQLDGNFTLNLPSLLQNEFLIPISLSLQGNELLITPLYPKIFINEEKLNFTFQPLRIELNGFVPDKITFADFDHSLDLTSGQTKSYLLRDFPNKIILESNGQQREYTLETSLLSQDPQQIPLVYEQINSFKVVMEKIDSPLSEENILQTQKYNLQKNIEQMNPFSKEAGTSDAELKNDALKLSAQSSSIQMVFYSDKLYHQASYLVLAETGYVSGLPINFYIDNPFERRAELEALLSRESNKSVLVIPATQNFFQGYGFHFTVKSVGVEETVSTLKKVGIYPFPKATLEQITITDSSSLVRNDQVIPVEFSHSTPSLYTVILTSNSQPATLILSQSFDTGWRAYRVNQTSLAAKTFPFLFGSELKDHVKINNWANGWNIDHTTNNASIVIVYLPQYLQFLGLLLPVLALLVFVAKKTLSSLKRKA